MHTVPCCHRNKHMGELQIKKKKVKLNYIKKIKKKNTRSDDDYYYYY